MRAKKPQTRMAGGALTKSLKTSVMKTTKQNTATKQRSNTSPVKSAASKKLTMKKSASNANAKATKDESETNDKKSKSSNRVENNAADKTSPIASNASKEKPINRNKAKADKKSSTPATINGEKKAALGKDEKIIKPSKELKNLDIQICGYSSVAAARESTGSDSDTDRIIKASICEIVKTKARAASATFNSSGNRSPSVNSPGPNHSKQSANASHDKSNKTEAASKVDHKSDDKSKKKKEPSKKPSKEATNIKSPTKSKSMKSTEDEEKSKKNPSENKKPETDKNANKSQQKAKTKATDDSAKCSAAPVVSTEKRIEIKTQVDESKSLIDTITEAINEVVKQYKDSSNTDSNAPPSNSQKATKKTNKIVKTPKKKAMNEKKLSVIGSASDLVNETKAAIKTISKKAKTKPKPKSAKDNKTDDIVASEQKSSDEKIAAKEAAADSKVSIDTTDAAASKKANDKPTKSATKGKAKPKASKKSTSSDQTEAKGSKIIKIDLKAKKKVKSLATAKSAALKSAAKQLQNKATKEPKLCQDDAKKNDEHKLHANPDEMSDDDNLSLTELKAQLTLKGDVAKVDFDVKNSHASTKLVNATSNSAPNKQKATKSSFKKPSVSNVESSTPQKKKLTSQKETATTTNPANRSDVYDFQDANFVGDDVPYVHKKKREKLPSNVAATNDKDSGKKDDVTKRPVEKSKTLPPKKQIRHETAKEMANDTKNDSKATVSSSKSSAKTSKRDASEENVQKPKKTGKAEKGEHDEDNKISETKKTAKANANNSHKLAAKNRRMKLFGFYSGPKRHRMASLNALAKVQCLYENESRTAQELGFVKEPQNVQRMKIVSDADKTEANSAKNHGKDKEVGLETEKKEKKEKKQPPKKDGDTANVETQRDDVVVGNNRTLRKVPAARGEGSMWEMENSSLDESEPEKKETVRNIQLMAYNR